ncbi:hypothetical protein [Paenibacillus spongiae]|uniref:Uncharacterized protein n=1 Tax=Paenibacillus spongiae TaxID=2909671 RepID=A0ABY5SEP3_9BACL|nr:hypothetical protein [Paenibacillus spongiae]UVI32114.1 hypothetical protein L1F29_09970 [Paenibacillus spongiae]
MTVEIHATFPGGAGAREAELKLQALRAVRVTDGGDGSLTITVGDDMIDRALHLIEQTGGMPDTH